MNDMMAHQLSVKSYSVRDHDWMQYLAMRAEGLLTPDQTLRMWNRLMEPLSLPVGEFKQMLKYNDGKTDRVVATRNHRDSEGCAGQCCRIGRGTTLSKAYEAVK
jgi:hypothetical protein